MDSNTNGRSPLAAQEEGWAAEFSRDSADGSLAVQPLNLEPSSAPVPASSPAAAPSSSSPPLGRATSSKRCILLCCFISATTIALGIGLSIGLSGDDDSSTGGGSTNSSSSQVPATVYGTSLPQQCQDLAAVNYWDVVNITRYKLSLELTEEMFQYQYQPSTAGPGTFTATASLLFTVQQQATSCLVLNARNLTFQSIALQTQLSDGSFSTSTAICNSTNASTADCTAGKGAVVSLPFERRANADATQPLSTGDMDLVSIDLGATLQPNTTATLVLEYSGLLGDWPTGNQGLHRTAPFSSADGDELEVMVVTQLEPTGARQLLPCYDQPARKAVFEVTLQVPSTTPAGTPTVALINTPVRNRLGGANDAIHIYDFQPTPLMSPYLLAIAAGDLVQYTPTANSSTDQEAAGSTDGLPELRLWAAPGLEGQLAEAAEVARRAFQFYGQYFAGISLPAELTKMDLVAVPGKHGAMENWGLLMFDEPRLLFDKAGEGAYGLRQLVLVVCHEVAHQWVGNLATKQDWTMLSVDEGLASFVEYKCLESMDGFEGQSHIHFFRGTTPQLQQAGSHDSPNFMALATAADPTTPPMVPPNDLSIGTGGLSQYSKPAALLHAQEVSLKELSGGQDVMPELLATMLKRAAYSTWNWSQYSVAARDTMLSYNTPQGDALAAIMEDRSGSFMRARSYDEVMDIIAEGKPTYATWFYSPLYPIFSLDKTPDGEPVVSWTTDPPNPSEPLASNPTNPMLLSMWNFNQTLHNIGATAQPFCAYEISKELAEQLGVTELADELNLFCDIPVGSRYFPLTIALDNLTACAAEGNTQGQWVMRFGELIATPTWVDNQLGAGLMRSVYEQSHLQSIVGVMGSITEICKDDEGNTTCCTSQADLLEGAAVLGDLLALAQTGHQLPLAAGVTPVLALQAIEGAMKDVGAPSDGEWQYLVSHVGFDSLSHFKRCVDWVKEERPNCLSDFREYSRAVMNNTATVLNNEWLVGSTITDSILKQLVGPRMLWQLAFIDSHPIIDNMCRDFTLTPLWQRMLDVLGGGPGDLDVQAQPAGLVSNASDVSPDLLPALYILGSALPTACQDALLGDAAVPADVATTADLAEPLLTALQRCYLTDPSDAEAERCLYGMPWLASLAETNDPQEQSADSIAVETVLRRTLPWVAAGDTSVCEGFESDPPQFARCLRRATDLPGALRGMAGAITVISSAHYAALHQFMQENWSSEMCDVMTGSIQPMSKATYDQLMEMLTTGPAKDCPARHKMSLAGKAEMQKEIMDAQALATCDHVAQQAEAWRDQSAP